MDEKKNLNGEEGIKEQAGEACPSIFDKPDPDRYRKNEKPVKKSNRQVKNIVIALVLCVTLVASTTGISYLLYGKNPIAFLKEYFAGEEESSGAASSQDERLLIHDYSAYSSSDADTETLALGGVKKVTVVQPNETYEITSTPCKTVDIDPQTYEEVEKDSLEWKVSKIQGKDISGIHFSPTLSGFVVTDVLQIPYNSVYTQNGNDQIPQGGMTYYEECGITDSKNRLTVEFKNGATVTVIVGNKAPTENMVFLALDNNDAGKSDVKGAPVKDTKIYKVTADAIAYYAKDTQYFINKDIVSPVPQDDDIFVEETGDTLEDPYFISGELSKFDSLSIGGANYKKPFTFEMVDSDKPGYDSIYLMTSPVIQNVDLDAMTALLSPMANGLTADACLVMKPTSADLAKYGLANPACVVRYQVKEENCVLKIGNSVKSNTYAVMVEGNASIFEVSVTNLPFASYTQADFASDTLYSCDITLIDTLRIQTGGKDELYRLKHGEGADGKATLTVTARNGRTVDTEKFRSMYVQLLSLTSFTNVNDGKDAANPYVTITITYDDYSQTDVIRLSPYTDRRYFMSLNGMGSTVVLSNSVDAFVDAFNALG